MTNFRRTSRGPV